MAHQCENCKFRANYDNFEESIGKDLHQYLLSMKQVDERLPECPDVEEKWEEIAQTYLPDGIREFQSYPTTSRVNNALRHQLFEPGTKEAFNGYVACLHQLYLKGAAIQLKRMGYHMTLMN